MPKTAVPKPPPPHRAATLTTVIHRKKYDLHPLGLRVEEPLTFEDWSAIGVWLEALERGIQWWVGDWMVWGETSFGDDYVQAVEATGWQLETVLQYRRVAERVPFARRRAELSFSHHRAVMELEADAQVEWLEKAIADDWSVDRLQRELKHAVKGETTLWVLVEAKDHGDADALVERFHLEGRKAKLSGGK